MNMRKSYYNKTSGFTLIELLIVVAIIAILAAIAIPNFLQAQVRAKVSRAQSEIRSIVNGLESYSVDENAYPDTWFGFGTGTMGLIRLTTPIAYITSIPNDIFGNKSIYTGPTGTPCYIWNNRTGDAWYVYWGDRWGIIQSLGPQGAGWSGNGSVYWAMSNMEYDPTNGTVSAGRIQRLVPGSLKLEDTLPH